MPGTTIRQINQDTKRSGSLDSTLGQLSVQCGSKTIAEALTWAMIRFREHWKGRVGRIMEFGMFKLALGRVVSPSPECLSKGFSGS